MPIERKLKYKPKAKGHGPKKKVTADQDDGSLAVPPAVKLAGKWNPTLAFRLYDLFRNGVSPTAAAGIMGLRKETVIGWLEKVPLAKMAKAAADAARSEEANSLQEHIFGQLPAELKPIWRRMEELTLAEMTPKVVEGLIQDQGKRGRQYLFFQALAHESFDATKACQWVGISRRTLNNWLDEPEFAEVMSHIQIAKKDLGESALWDLVKQGDANAIMFVNRTLNRDRGFGDTKSIKIDQTTTHRHLIDIDELDLSLEIRKAIWEAMKKKEAESTPAHLLPPAPSALPPVREPIIIDAEIVEEATN